MALQFPFLKNTKRLRVLKLLIIEAGSFNPQYHRPYQSVIDAGSVNAVRARVEQDGINANSLCSVINDVLYPSIQPELDAYGQPKQIAIDNGWGEPRFRYLLLVEVDDGISARQEVIQGWSNHMSTSLQGTVDPDIEFHINSISTVRQINYRTPTGMESGLNVVSSSHVLANNYYGGFANNGFAPENLFHIRPTDLYTMMSTSHVNDLVHLDTTGLMTDTPTLGNRSNNVPSSYASRVLEGMYNANMVDSMNMGVNANDQDVIPGMDSIFSKAKSYAREQVPTDLSFMSAIASLREVSATDYWTLNELRRLDPNTDAVSALFVIPPASRASIPSATNSEYWHGQDATTHVASILGSVIPSLMMEAGLTKMGFTATNRTIGNVIMVTPTGVGGMAFADGQSVARQMEIFKINLINKCLNSIAMNGMRDFQINVEADLMGTTSMSIALDGSNLGTPYVQPSFCDALMSPIVTQDQKVGHALANDMSHLINEAVLVTQGSSALVTGASEFNF